MPWIEIECHDDADRNKVASLVNECGSELLGAITIQLEHGRPGQAYVHTEEYLLAAFEPSYARKCGFSPKDKAEVFVFGAPNSSDYAKSVCKALNKDKNTVWFEP